MDLIIGMGEVGSTLYALFVSNKIKCAGFDSDSSKLKNYPPTESIECMHITLPFKESFSDIVLDKINQHKPKFVMIHSTVKVGTSKSIQAKTETPIIYAPTRGKHDRFLEDMIFYTKFFAYDFEENFKIRDLMARRFKTFKRGESTIALELAKVLTDTTYLGLLVAYRKFVDETITKQGVKDCDAFWEMASEAHKVHGNRPIMFNDGKKIGGHCVLPNLELLDSEYDQIISFIKKYGEHDQQ